MKQSARQFWFPLTADNFAAGAFDRFAQQLARKAFNAFVEVNRQMQKRLVGFGFNPNPDAFEVHVVPPLTLCHEQQGTRGRQLPPTHLTQQGYSGNNWASSIRLLIGEYPVSILEVHG